jgi:hypothetical protein
VIRDGVYIFKETDDLILIEKDRMLKLLGLYRIWSLVNPEEPMAVYDTENKIEEMLEYLGEL